MSPRNFQEIFLGHLIKASVNRILIMLGVFILGIVRHWHFHRLDELYTPHFHACGRLCFKHGEISALQGLRIRATVLKGIFFMENVFRGPWAIIAQVQET